MKKLYADPGSIVECYWIDSCGPCGAEWKTTDDINQSAMSIRTAGIVHQTSKETVTILLNLVEDQGVDQWITIPQVAITEWRQLWP